MAIVTSGTLSLYDSADPSCTAQRISAGHGFTEQAGHVHLARNEGRKSVVVLVTYLGLKHGVNPDVPAASPGNCRSERHLARHRPGAAAPGRWLVSSAWTSA